MFRGRLLRRTAATSAPQGAAAPLPGGDGGPGQVVLDDALYELVIRLVRVGIDRDRDRCVEVVKEIGRDRISAAVVYCQVIGRAAVKVHYGRTPSVDEIDDVANGLLPIMWRWTTVDPVDVQDFLRLLYDYPLHRELTSRYTAVIVLCSVASAVFDDAEQIDDLRPAILRFVRTCYPSDPDTYSFLVAK